MENATLKDLLKEHMDLKGLSIKKVSESTGIPERYMEAMVMGKNHNLPPSPYVRGYITKLAAVLDFDKETIWRIYKEETVFSSSGPWDKLPGNRFAVKVINKKWLIGGFITLLLLSYLSSNVYEIFQVPNLSILNPEEESSISGNRTTLLKGKMDPSSTLTINGAEVYVDKEGYFEKEHLLQSGLNTIEFVAKKFLGKEHKVIRQIIYQPPPAEDIKNEQIIIKP